MKNGVKKILVIVNPVAGGRDKETVLEELEKLAEQNGVEQKIYRTTGNDDAEDIQKEILLFQPDILLAAGGDGTVNLAARCLLGKNISLGIIPLGSANALATDLEIPDSHEEAYELAMQKNAAAFDVLRVNEKHLCLHLSDIGFNANLIKRFEEEEKRGMGTYAKAFLKELFNHRSHRYFFSIGEKKFSSRAMMVAFANARKYGTGAIINPKGNFEDNRFEVCIIKPYPWYALARMCYLFFVGKLHRSRYVNIISTDFVKVKVRRPQVVHVDGELIGEQDELTVRMLKEKIFIISKRETTPALTNAAQKEDTLSL